MAAGSSRCQTMIRVESTAVEAFWVSTENEPIYSQEHMEQFRQVISVITLTFRVIR